MKCTPLLLIGSLLFSLVWLGCGGDTDTDTRIESDDAITTDNGSDLHVTIVGTWQLVAIEPHIPGVGALPNQILTVKPDGTWGSTTVVETPGLGKFTVTAEGNYQLSENRIIGETTATRSEPDLGIPLPIHAGMPGEATIKRDGDTLTITSRDETSGQTTITVYEKQ
jgi:hypothetical protein